MRKVEQQLANTITWAASTAITPINLPNEQVLTRIDVDWKVSLDVASNESPNDQAVRKALWNQFSIQGGPSFFVNLTNPVLVEVQNKLAHGGVVQDLFLTATASAAIHYVRERYHFGSVEHDPFDLTAAIIGPTFAKGGLLLGLTNPANSVCGTGITINTTTTGKIITSGLLMTQDEIAAARIAQPSFTETDIQLSSLGTSTGLASRQDMPVGQYVRALNFWLGDNGTVGTTQAADDTRISTLGIAVSGEGDRRIIYEDWVPLRNRSAIRLGNPLVSTNNTPTAGAVDTGFARIDFRSLTSSGDPRAPLSSLYGLNLQGQQAGNYQIAMSVATANGSLDVAYEQIKPA